jgi:hypothetical protein
VSSAKVYVVIEDHQRESSEAVFGGMGMQVYPFSGFVLGNPAVRMNGHSEEEVVKKIKHVLVDQYEGPGRKLVEVDLGDHIVARDVMNRWPSRHIGRRWRPASMGEDRRRYG